MNRRDTARSNSIRPEVTRRNGPSAPPARIYRRQWRRACFRHYTPSAVLRTAFKRFALKIERRALRTAPADLAGPEKRLHWVRDATFHEDNSQVRTGTRPAHWPASETWASARSALPDEPTSLTPSSTTPSLSTASDQLLRTQIKRNNAGAVVRSRQPERSQLLQHPAPRPARGRVRPKADRPSRPH